MSKPPKEDLIGKRFGRLTVEKYCGRSGGHPTWKVACDCGKDKILAHSNLVKRTRSCGCLQRQLLSARRVAGDEILRLANRPALIKPTGNQRFDNAVARLGWALQINQHSLRLGVSGIYAIVNKANGLIYIGSSECIRMRILTHLSAFRNSVHKNEHLTSDWNSRGCTSFVFVLVEVCFYQDLETRESFWITETRCANRDFGYNIQTFATRAL